MLENSYGHEDMFTCGLGSNRGQEPFAMSGSDEATDSDLKAWMQALPCQMASESQDYLGHI